MEHNTNLLDTISNIKEELNIREKINESKDKIRKLNQGLKELYAREHSLNFRIYDEYSTNGEKENARLLLSENKKRINDLQQIRDNFEKTIKSAENSLHISLDNTLKIIDGMLYVTDKEAPVKVRDDYTDVLVHMTDYFPENHIIKCPKSAKATIKQDIETENGPQSVEIVRNRQTVHFVKNGIVKPQMYRYVSNSKYVIIEPEKFHTNRFGNDSDTWIFGDVNLSNQAILVTDKENYDKLTDIEKNEFYVILSEGNIIECVENLIKDLGIPPIEGYNVMTPAHAASRHYRAECIEDFRDAYLKYIIKDNDHQENNQYDISILNKLINLYSINNPINILNSGIYRSLPYELDIPAEKDDNSFKTQLSILKIIFDCGIKINGNNFSFANTEEIIKLQELYMYNGENKPDRDKLMLYLKEQYQRIYYEFYKEQIRNSLSSSISDCEDAYKEYPEEIGSVCTFYNASNFAKNTLGITFDLTYDGKKFTINDTFSFEPKSKSERDNIIYATLDTIMKSKGVPSLDFLYENNKEQQQDLSDGTSR